MKPIPITKNNHSKMELDLLALMKILKNSKYAEYPVAVYAVAGPYRSGKSFLQNLLIQYIQAHQHSDAVKAFTASTIENFFESRTGITTCTEGIHMLSEPFILDKMEGGTKVALYLMDTQGMFDNKASAKSITMMGILNFLMSSVQFFNVKRQLARQHFEYIYKFIEFVQKVKEEDSTGTCSPYQKNSLAFIIRDWENEEEIPFGFCKDESFFNRIFETNVNCGQEHLMTKEYFSSVFGSIPILLLPHPGRAVRKTPCYFSALDEQFQEGILQLCDNFLTPQNIVVKQINGKPVTCSELFTSVETLFPYLEENVNKNVQSFIQASLETQLQSLMMNCASSHFKDVDKQCTKIRNGSHRKSFLVDLNSKTMKNFERAPKHDKKMYWKWRDELEKLLELCNEAIEECMEAEKIYTQKLEEIHNWLTEVLESAKSKSDFPEEDALQKKKNELIEDLKKSISEKIVVDCCQYLMEDFNVLLTSTKDDFEKFFAKKKKKDILNMCLGTAITIAGATVFVAGVLTNDALILTSFSGFMMQKGIKKMKSKKNKQGYKPPENPKSYSTPEIGLQQQDNGKVFLSLQLGFGKIVYPLKSF